jgi:hypothetical protein
VNCVVRRLELADRDPVKVIEEYADAAEARPAIGQLCHVVGVAVAFKRPLDRKELQAVEQGASSCMPDFWIAGSHLMPVRRDADGRLLVGEACASREELDAGCARAAGYAAGRYRPAHPARAYREACAGMESANMRDICFEGVVTGGIGVPSSDGETGVWRIALRECGEVQIAKLATRCYVHAGLAADMSGRSLRSTVAACDRLRGEAAEACTRALASTIPPSDDDACDDLGSSRTRTWCNEGRK